jgi:hypothetical protein
MENKKENGQHSREKKERERAETIATWESNNIEIT